MDTVRIDSAPPTTSSRPHSQAASRKQRFDSDPDAGWIIVAHVLAPLAGMLSGWMALTIAGRRSEFVRQHARQAINFQCNAIGAMIISLILQINVSALFFLVGLSIALAATIWCFVAAARAKRGEWMPYPQLVPVLRSLPEPPL